MDQSKVEQLIEQFQDRYIPILGLQDLRIYTGCESLDEGTAAHITFSPAYNRVDIHFDPAQIVDEADCERLVRHELIHALLLPLEAFAAMLSTVDLTDDVRNLIDWQKTHTSEQLVIRVGLMLKNALESNNELRIHNPCRGRGDRTT